MDGQILALIITTVGGFTTLVFKSIHDQSVAKERHNQERQDRLEDAAIAKAEREDEARLVRERLELSARELAAKATAVSDKVASTERHLNATLVAHAQLTQVALNEQTVAITQKIDEARTHMAQRADLAFNEANDVNTKIAKLHQAQLQQAAVLERLLGRETVS